MKLITRIILLLVFLCLSSFAAYAYFLNTELEKVVDPSSPDFNIDEFALTDYCSRSDLTSALYKIFPEGTDKANVDALLVEKLGVTVTPYSSNHPDLKGKILFWYDYNVPYLKLISNFNFLPGPPPGMPSHHISIQYNDELKLQEIRTVSALSIRCKYIAK